MKRLALFLFLVPAFVAACGGDSGGGLAEAPTAPAAGDEMAAPASDDATTTADDSGDGAAPDGEEVGEQRGLGEVDGEAAEPAEETDPAAEPPASAREEDTSRPLAAVLAGKTLDGEPISLEDFKGQPVVVKVFAEH